MSELYESELAPGQPYPTISRKGQSLASIGVMLPRSSLASCAFRQSASRDFSASLYGTENGENALRQKVTVEAFEVYGSPFVTRHSRQIEKLPTRMVGRSRSSFSISAESMGNEQ